jgi:fatty-acyl-CoA synthase
VTTAALASGFEALRAECPELSSVIVRETLGGPPLDAASPHALDDIAFVQFTSGSTAAPKGVAISHRNLAANVEAIISHLAVRPDDVAVSWLPLYHDMGLIGMSIGAVYCQRRCVLLPPALFVKRPVEWLRAIRRHRGTVSFAPNFAYDLCVRRVKDRDLADLDLSSWRVAGCGAEPLNAATLAAFAERFAPVGFSAAKFVASYGLAEHVLAATFAPGGRAPRVERVSAGELIERRRAVAADGARASVALVSCGVPLPGHQLKIAGEDGDALSERRVGEILLAGPSVMLGYYRQHARTAQAVRDGWLRTGDLGFVADGELFVCGRAKDLIIVNGRKYHPQDLEWAVDELPGVRRGRVVAFGTSETGRPDRVVVVVESSGTSAQDALTEAIRRRIGDLFGLFVDVVAVVPGGTVGRTTSGKVQRALTRARYERGELVGLA